MKIGAPQIIFIVLIIVMLFGAKRLPDVARSVGESLRILKAEAKDLTGDDSAKIDGETTLNGDVKPKDD